LILSLRITKDSLVVRERFVIMQTVVVMYVKTSFVVHQSCGDMSAFFFCRSEVSFVKFAA
jgi:hypothetical protein